MNPLDAMQEHIDALERERDAFEAALREISVMDMWNATAAGIRAYARGAVNAAVNNRLLASSKERSGTPAPEAPPASASDSKPVPAGGGTDG